MWNEYGYETLTVQRHGWYGMDSFIDDHSSYNNNRFSSERQAYNNGVYFTENDESRWCYSG